MDRLALVPADDRTDVLEIALRRQKRQFVREEPSPVAPGFNPRSRMVLLTVEDRVPLNGQLTAMIGFQGVKLNNESVNVTAMSRDDRLRARDWFMPRAAITLAPGPDLALTASYREILRGFGETGHSGPMGMAHEEFRSLARTLKPERQDRLRFDAHWQASADFGMVVSAYEGRIGDRLVFADRTYLPRNGGSARLRGVSAGFSHRLSPHWRWAVRYGQARLDGADRAKESSLSVETGWTSGPWRARLRGAWSSAPALAGEVRGSGRRVRMEADMRYQLSDKPLAITLRITDPDRLASTALLSDAPSGLIRATDQARGLMLGAEWVW